jgi:glycosyltransferase involved in cell wall biosynthesis
MRCVLTVNFSPWSRYSGGGQRSTHNLARALARRGHEVAVVFTKPPWEQVPVPDALPYQVVWAALPALRSRSNAWLRPSTPIFVADQVRRLLGRATSQPHAIVHGNGEEAALVPELRRSGALRSFGFVMTPRYPSLPAGLAADAPRLRKAWNAALRTKYVLLGRALRGADAVCPTSRYAAELIEHAYGLSGSLLHVTPNGVSDEFLRVAAPGADSLPRIACDPELEHSVFAIYFGRIAREKGVLTLIEALARSGPEPPLFVFAGRGPELPRLQARARALGLERRVRFITWLDAEELAGLVRRASFAVLPSREESFGNTMAEAMALAVPVISTTAGSIPELIEHDRTGVLVAPGDADALAQAMRALAGDASRRRAIGAAARAHVVEHLTWDASAASFERIYEGTLERGG